MFGRLRAAQQVIASAPARLVTPRNWRRLVAFLVLALVGLLTLAVLDFIENSGLWGDFVFAFVVTSVVIALAGHAISDERWQRWGVVPPTTSFAPFWAMFILLDIPLAIVSWWYGAAALVVVLGVLWIALPSVRLGVFLTTAVMLIFVAVLSAHTGARQPQVSDTTSLHRAGALAHRYRPILLFDSDEVYAPVDVERAIRTHHVRACHKTIVSDDCPKIEAASDIDSDVEFLKLKASTLGPGDDTGGGDSAIYYHAVERSDPPRVYLDYWWFFTENPEPVLSALLCRAGLHLGEITCFRHEADWEGMTVILAPCDDEPEIATACVPLGRRRLHLVGVAYAEHGGPAKRFGWNTLAGRWAAGSAPTDGERPLVYVALNSHAAYPFGCPPRCVAREESNDGAAPWGNNGAACVSTTRDCVQPLPLDAAGKPTSWNAFAGPWGAQHCILDGAYCDGGPAPRGPALHSRYGRPDRVH
jgi:hypothetical protein